ncbi:MAG: hypothetical protein AAFR35_02320 [Pseudomonadota bacterium]
MSAQNLFEVITKVSSLVQELESAGMRVEIGGDFAQYRVHRGAQADRGAIYPMFDVASSYIDKSNGFWICGFSESNELIHTQAVRLLDLSDVTLAQHLKMHRHKYITPNTTPDPDLTFYSGPEALEAISGRVCYHGDFWLRSRGLGGPRSQGATSVLSRIMFEIMCQCWSPDFVFALVPKQLAAKGAHLRYGYSHCEPGKWIGPDQQVTEEDYMIWMNARDLSNAIGREIQSLRSGDQVSVISSTLTAIDTNS